MSGFQVTNLLNDQDGYSPITYKTYELIELAAQKGVHEAEKWVKENSQDKVWFFPWFDYGGSIWGPSNIAFTNNYWYKKPDYWVKVKSNVEFLHQKGYLSKDQWEMWNKWYLTKDQYMNKTEADFPPQHKFYYDNIMKGREAQGEVLKWKMPGEPLFKELWEIGYREEKK